MLICCILLLVMCMKVIYLDIDKCDIKLLDTDTKYVVFANDLSRVKDFINLEIKPIFILNQGAYIIDLDNKNVIIKEPILKEKVDIIVDYCNKHNVSYDFKKVGSDIFEIILNTDNVHRRLIIPYYFKDYVSLVKCNVKDDKIYVINQNVSILRAIEEVDDYLNIGGNILEIDDIYQHIKGIGYFKERKVV